MKISPSKLILALSLLANVGLGLLLGLMSLSIRFDDHYYRDFTSMLIQSTHDEVAKGNIQPTLKILEEIPWRPEYRDLTDAVSKFSAMKQAPTEAEQDGTGQPATRSESKSDGKENPKPESEGRSR